MSIMTLTTTPYDDIDALLEDKAWTGLGKKKIRIVGSLPPKAIGFDPVFVKRFPKLTKLLKLARVTDFQTSPKRVNSAPSKPGSVPNDQVIYRVWAWTTRSGKFAAWPASPVSSMVTPALSTVSEDHLLILRHLGGINFMGCCVPEDFECPDDNFALNQNFIFGSETRPSVKLWVKGYEYDHRHKDSETLIEPYVDFAAPEWVCFAQEANGNELLYDRSDRDRVLLVSGDHCFKHVRPSTRYRWRYDSGRYRWDSLLEIDGVVTLHDWAEKLAAQWLARIA
jgi:hypothetical protein